MFKKLLLPCLSIGLGLLPVAVWSDMAKRFDDAQAFFTRDISQLASLVDNVLNNNPGIQAIEANVKAAGARQDAAQQALYNPQLELDYEHAGVNTSSLGIIQTIDWSDKRGSRTQFALYETNQSIAQLNIARQSLAAELLHNLSAFHTAEDKDALTQLRIELLQEFVALARQRYHSGDVNQSELSLAQLALAEAAMQRSRVASQLMLSRQALIILHGSDNNHWPGLPLSLPALEFKTEQLEQLISLLPEIQEQSARVSAAKAKVTLRSREQNADPTIAIRAGSDDTDNLIGLTVSIPLTIRNTYQAEVRVANAQLIEAEFNNKNLTRQLKSRLISSAQRYQLVRAAWLSWQKTGQTSMARQFSLIHKQWQAGEISSTDYFLQLNQTLDTRLSAIELRQELWTAWVDWLNATASVTQWLTLNNAS